MRTGLKLAVSPPELYSFPFTAMGTSCSVHLYALTALEAEKSALGVRVEIARIEGRYSCYREDSLLSEINRVAMRGDTFELDEETMGLFAYARSCHEKSDGLFDITSGMLRRAWNFSSGQLPEPEEIERLLPLVGLQKMIWDPPRIAFPIPGMEIDLGGIGKEYAADRAAALCLSAGIRHGLIDLGGDIRIIGPHPDGSPWKIGIRNPFISDSLAGTVALSGGALATSGDYERRIECNGKRYGHILDPRTGWPVQGLTSVSVAADQCLAAGSLATLAMLRGREGIAWLTGLASSILHLWIDSDGMSGGTLPVSVKRSD